SLPSRLGMPSSQPRPLFPVYRPFIGTLRGRCRRPVTLPAAALDACPVLCSAAMRCLLFLLLLAPLAAAAQPDERLPDLTPSVFEIQGELEIDLPQLER